MKMVIAYPFNNQTAKKDDFFSLATKCQLKSQLDFADYLYDKIKVNQNANPRLYRKGPITQNNFNPNGPPKIAMELFDYLAKYPC